MSKGQEHGKLHGCIVAAALKGICYLTKYKLIGLKVSIKTKNKIVKNSGKHQSQSTVTCRSRSQICVMQLLQSYRCIYVPVMMIVAATVCEIQT